LGATNWMAGCTEKNSGWLVVTMNVSVWLASLVGPAPTPVAQFGTVWAPLSSFTVWSGPRVKVGTSLTDRTGRVATALVALKAVLPPLTLASPMPPVLPLVWSQARKVKVAEPKKLGAGTKRIGLLGRIASSRAWVSDGAPKSSQVAPPSVENCQRPLVLSAPVTAMPRGAVPGA